MKRSLNRFGKRGVTLRTLYLLAAVSAALLAQNTGTVSGVVVDGEGNPIPGARVRLAREMRAMNLDDTFLCGTDGRFTIGGVAWGTYVVQAMKPEDGYPDPFVLMYRYHISQPTVSISPASPIADVKVPIGPKGARLFLNAVDAKTMKDVDSTSLTLRRLDDPYVRTELPVDSKSVLIPSGAPLMITIHATGYSDWYYPGVPSQAFAEPLSLSAGEEKKLDVRLSPVAAKE